MDWIAAGFRDYVNDAAREPAKFRAITVCNDTELLNRIRVRGGISGVAETACVVAAVEIIVDRTRTAGRPFQRSLLSGCRADFRSGPDRRRL